MPWVAGHSQQSLKQPVRAVQPRVSGMARQSSPLSLVSVSRRYVGDSDLARRARDGSLFGFNARYATLAATRSCPGPTRAPTCRRHSHLACEQACDIGQHDGRRQAAPARGTRGRRPARHSREPPLARVPVCGSGRRACGRRRELPVPGMNIRSSAPIATRRTSCRPAAPGGAGIPRAGNRRGRRFSTRRGPHGQCARAGEHRGWSGWSTSTARTPAAAGRWSHTSPTPTEDPAHAQPDAVTASG